MMIYKIGVGVAVLLVLLCILAFYMAIRALRDYQEDNDKL